MKILFQLLIFSSLILGCQNQVVQSDPEKTFPTAFQKGLDTHGGIDKWNSYGTLNFSEIGSNDTTTYTVDLVNRNELIEKSGHYKVGFTADEINFYPNRDSFPNENPRFIHNLRFYFFALPFVTADPGTIHTELPPAQLDGKMYDRTKVTFDEGVGVAPKDQYILWFDQKDHLLSLINYSVTYFDEENAEKYNAIRYQNWVESGGLKFPTEMIGYKWENDSLGEERYRRKFSDISVLKERPDSTIFIDL